MTKRKCLFTCLLFASRSSSILIVVSDDDFFVSPSFETVFGFESVLFSLVGRVGGVRGGAIT